MGDCGCAGQADRYDFEIIIRIFISHVGIYHEELFLSATYAALNFVSFSPKLPPPPPQGTF